MKSLAGLLSTDPEVTRIELGPLEPAHIEQLVVDALGEKPAHNTLTAVAAGARGNPLIALELARSASSLVDVRLSDAFEQLYGARLESLVGRSGSRRTRPGRRRRAACCRPRSWRRVHQTDA